MLLAESWTTVLDNMDPERLMGLLVIGIGCLTAVVITLGIAAATVVNAVHRRTSDNQMKREMLGMGMSSAEIAQVLEAGSPDSMESKDE